MASESEDSPIQSPAELEEDDLFGDEDGDLPEPKEVRELSDQELDSGDDEERHDRARSTALDEDAENSRSAVIADARLIRHPIPNSMGKDVCRGGERS